MTLALASPYRDFTARAGAQLNQFSLVSDRLELRPLCMQDAELYCGLYTDRGTMRCIGPTLTARQAARSFKAALRIGARALDGPLFITIIERASQDSLGLCAIQQILMRRAETGVIVKAAARGRGIATESLRTVIEWGFVTLPLEHIWVRCSVHNTIAELLFRAVGLSRQPVAAAEPAEVIWSVDRNSWHFK
jgi:RimJ/RimL family protein N-acetyltransferase